MDLTCTFSHLDAVRLGWRPTPLMENVQRTRFPLYFTANASFPDPGLYTVLLDNVVSKAVREAEGATKDATTVV